MTGGAIAVFFVYDTIEARHPGPGEISRPSPLEQQRRVVVRLHRVSALLHQAAGNRILAREAQGPTVQSNSWRHRSGEAGSSQSRLVTSAEITDRRRRPRDSKGVVKVDVYGGLQCQACRLIQLDRLGILKFLLGEMSNPLVCCLIRKIQRPAGEIRIHIAWS